MKKSHYPFATDVFKYLLALVLINYSFITGLMGQTIKTVAGSTIGYAGDGGPATAAKLNSNWGMAIDHVRGLIYVADFNNNAIRRVNMGTGIITTCAGTGTGGYSGDGGPATAARIANPTGVAVDNAGNVYFSDIGNHRIRKVDIATGIISTYAGTGVSGATGDGGPAVSATIGMANGICTDNLNNLFIPDYVPQTVRKVAAGTGIINTMAGTPYSAGSSGDGGPATTARLNLSNDAAADNYNNIYISDWSNQKIRKVDAATGIITTFCGTGAAGFSGDGGPATAAVTLGTMGFDFDCDNNMIICDVDNHRLRYINTSGIITTIAGTGTASLSGDGGTATAASMNRPVKAVFDAIGNIYVSDRNNGRIRMIGLTKTVCIGSTATFCNRTGTGLFSTSDATVATVTSAGVVTGVAAGTATITLTMPSGYYVTAEVIVNPASSSITGVLTVCAGGTTSLGATAAGGTWSISPSSIATITAGGVVTGVMAGTATVSYTGACGVATAVVTVSVGSGSITGSSTICAGGTLVLSSSATGGSWSIAPATVATISASGIVTGMALGTATVSYSLGCGWATTIVTVTSVPGAITGNVPICVGSTITLGNPVGGGTWSAFPATVATISATGIVTGIATGTATVVYSTLCESVSVTVTVTALPLPIKGNRPLCVGDSIVLSDATMGGTWSITPPGIATVLGGVVTGTAAGSATVSYTTACGPVTTIVTVYATPVISGPTSVLPGGTVTVTGTPLGGTWSCSSTVAAISATGIVSGLTSGTAIITYTSSAGCRDTAIINVTKYAAVGDEAGRHFITISPNPSCGAFMVSGALQGAVVLHVTDLVGRVVYATTTYANGGQLNEHLTLPDGIANGVYLLKVQGDALNVVEKIKVER